MKLSRLARESLGFRALDDITHAGMETLPIQIWNSATAASWSVVNGPLLSRAALRWAKIASRSTFSSRMVSKFAPTSLLACLCGKLSRRKRGRTTLVFDPPPGGLWTPRSVDSSAVFARLTQGGFALNIYLDQGQDCR